MAQSSLSKLKAKMLKDKGVKAEYERLENEFAVAQALLKVRKEANLTQEEVAKRMHTTRPQVAKIESGKTNMTIDSLQRYAHACGGKVNWKQAFAASLGKGKKK